MEPLLIGIFIIIIIGFIAVWFIIRGKKEKNWLEGGLGGLPADKTWGTFFNLHSIRSSNNLKSKKEELLISYANNAPEPPNEFTPVMRERPKQEQFFVGVFGSASNHKHKDFIAQYYFDEKDAFLKHIEDKKYSRMKEAEIPEGLREEINAFKKENEKRKFELHKWQLDFATERIVQWRFHYAEQMVNHHLKNIR